VLAESQERGLAAGGAAGPAAQPILDLRGPTARVITDMGQLGGAGGEAPFGGECGRAGCINGGRAAAVRSDLWPNGCPGMAARLPLNPTSLARPCDASCPSTGAAAAEEVPMPELQHNLALLVGWRRRVVGVESRQAAAAAGAGRRRRGDS
jgi:hypothetical protein